jgi:methanethiol S-methyltransferase
MGRLLALAYGLVCYIVFLAAFLYAIGFVGGFVVPKTVDSGPVGALIPSLLIDVGLLGVFAVQHSVMARPGFKAMWTRIVPPPVERATFVLLASLALILLYWQWRPLPTVLWSVGGVAATALWALNGLGWFVVLSSTFMINHFDLFGLRQVWAHATRAPTPTAEFRTPLYYRFVRHPIYLGFAIAFWATPHMTVGHLLFAAGATGYIFVGIFFEERDLVDAFGAKYRDYQSRVSMLIPWVRRSRG